MPVGVFLSGGLVAARWYEERGEKLKTFAVGLADAPDLLAARAVAEYLDTEHHESVYTAEEALGVLSRVVRTIENFDPTLIRSAIPSYILAEFTARHHPRTLPPGKAEARRRAGTTAALLRACNQKPPSGSLTADPRGALRSGSRLHVVIVAGRLGCRGTAKVPW